MDDTILALLLNLAAKHWPFVATAILLGAIGSIVKQLVTKKLAQTNRLAYWFRRTMPLHPVLAGAALGLSGVMPVCSSVPVAIYYALAGAVSAWVYDGVRHYLEKKGFVDLVALQAELEKLSKKNEP